MFSHLLNTFSAEIEMGGAAIGGVGMSSLTMFAGSKEKVMQLHLIFPTELQLRHKNPNRLPFTKSQKKNAPPSAAALRAREIRAPHKSSLIWGSKRGSGIFRAPAGPFPLYFPLCSHTKQNTKENFSCAFFAKKIFH